MCVTVQRNGQIVEITLDRPKANTLDVETSNRLRHALTAFRDDPDLMVAILTAAGDRFFSAGWDFNAAIAGESAKDDYGPSSYAGSTEMFNLRKPVIAAVNGYAVGGGFEVALACDLIVCADHAIFSLPEVRRGLMADGGGAIRLPKRIPRAIAMELLLTGRQMSASEAAHFGLVNRVVPLKELLPTARQLANDIVSAAPLAILGTMELVQNVEGLGVEDGYRRMRSEELELYERCHASEDAKEGPLAFMEKRAPVWLGR